jgi:kynurenine formamidase
MMAATITWRLEGANPRRSLAGRVTRWLVLSALLVAASRAAPAEGHRGREDQGDKSTPLWDFYDSALSRAKYIDLTHAIAPGGPIGEGFGDFKVGPSLAGVAIPGVINKGEPFSYEKLGVAITAYELPMDHIGTQFGPPAHENERGATISDIPPTVALRPLVVVNVAPKVAVDPGYQATVADIKDWERRHGPIPPGSVVMIRSDWSKKWGDPKRFTTQPFPGVSLAALKYL